jgi:hypothetical protein
VFNPHSGQKTGETCLSQIIIQGGLKTASKISADTAKQCHLFCGTVHVLVNELEIRRLVGVQHSLLMGSEKVWMMAEMVEDESYPKASWKEPLEQT